MQAQYQTIKKEDLVYDESNDDYTPDVNKLVIFSTKQESQVYKSKILGKTYRFTRQKVTEYLDPETGEIIALKQFKQLGGIDYNYGVFAQERNEILDTLREEVKDFACFLLKFRNKRRGISPSLEKILEYYSRFSSKRINNIRNRLLPKLYGKVLSNDNLLMPPFQFSGKNEKAYSHIAEEFVAENTFLHLMKKKNFKVECIA